MARHDRGNRRNVSCCGSPEHLLSRRRFIRGGAATALGMSLGGVEASYEPAWADELRRQGRHVILLWLAGGASQLETWDPKPRRPTGGPFVAIPTAATGVHIGELLPNMARIMDRVAVVRSLDTGIGDHRGASNLMDTGRGREDPLDYPDFGTVIAKELQQRDSDTPDYVSLFLATEGHRAPDPGFLGGRYTAMHLTDAPRPQNLAPPEGIRAVDYTDREHLREYLSERFNRHRNASLVTGYNSTYARIRGLMKSDSLFDLTDEPAAARDRYGSTEFGQQALIARRLVEAGVPMVKVARAWWDSHSENFESHRELVTELDRVMSALLLDLESRGLLDSTLVVTLSEFGRTPKINKNNGRDHFPNAWSFTLTGCGVRGGVVHGKTDADGNTVADGEAGAGDVLNTVYRAVGLDPQSHYYSGPRPVPLAPEDSQPIKTVLA